MTLPVWFQFKLEPCKITYTPLGFLQAHCPPVPSSSSISTVLPQVLSMQNLFKPPVRHRSTHLHADHARTVAAKADVSILHLLHHMDEVPNAYA
jgi:hypothetical protein